MNLIVKSRKIPLKIRKLEALLRRLPQAHPKRKVIEEDLAKSAAGYKGEQSLDYYLSFLPESEYFIFQDLRLFEKNHYFQLDTLILSPSFFLILEVKNISGTLTFDQTFHQLIRTVNGVEEVFPDPIQQVRHQQFQFQNWLKSNHCPLVPVDSLVVISNPHTQIKTSGNSKPQLPVIHSTSLLDKVNRLKEIYKEEILLKKDIRKLCKLLKKHDSPSNPEILERYQISKSDLLTGVLCTRCRAIPMDRKSGKWICPNCSFFSKDAHISALADYSLLVHSAITNEEAREFLHLSSRSIAHHLLMQMNIPYSGTTKGRAYSLSFDE